jgi:hypothetical protein
VEDSSFNRPPPDEDASSDEASLPTEPKAELTPPPRKPPVAVGIAGAGPESRPPRPVGLPPGLVRAVDRVLDALDAAADAVRAVVRGVAQ